MISNLAKTLEEMEQKAEKRGIEKGEIRKAKIIVRQMLRKGMDEDLIAELTGLSREEVEKMKEKND